MFSKTSEAGVYFVKLISFSWMKSLSFEVDKSFHPLSSGSSPPNTYTHTHTHTHARKLQICSSPSAVWLDHFMQKYSPIAPIHYYYLLKVSVNPKPGIEQFSFVSGFAATEVFHMCSFIFFTLSFIPALRFCALRLWKEARIGIFDPILWLIRWIGSPKVTQQLNGRKVVWTSWFQIQVFFYMTAIS